MNFRNRLSKPGRALSAAAIIALCAASILLVSSLFAATPATPITPPIDPTTAARRTVITAAGATFPLPFYAEALKRYWDKNDIPVTYAGIGTDRGIKSLRDLQIDFAGVDVPLTPDELQEMPAPTLLVPTALGAVEIAYHLDGVDNLRLTGELLADIYLGRIVKWNDPRIAAANPDISLPDKEICPVFRLDGSGTTYVFTHYLSTVSPAWAETVGTGKSLTFPRGVAATGTPGIAGLVEKIPGAIGYVASGYSASFDIQRALLKNAAGNYVHPSPESITAAAAAAVQPSPESVTAASAAVQTPESVAAAAAAASVQPRKSVAAPAAAVQPPESVAAAASAAVQTGDLTVMLTDSPAPEAYPISCFTWVMLYRDQSYSSRTREQAMETLALLRWLIGPEAQHIAAREHYAPLPTSVAARAVELLDSVTYGGKPLK